MAEVTIPVGMGGSGQPYTDGTGERGMASRGGWGFALYLIPMLAEVINACSYVVDQVAIIPDAIVGNGVAIGSGGFLGWSDTVDAATGPWNVRLYRGGAGILDQRNGANAQIFRPYNTDDGAGNFERGYFGWAGNALRIGTQKGGTGTARVLIAMVDGTDRWQWTTAGHYQPLLPNAYDVGLAATPVRTGFFNTVVIGGSGTYPLGPAANLGTLTVKGPSADQNWGGEIALRNENGTSRAGFYQQSGTLVAYAGSDSAHKQWRYTTAGELFGMGNWSDGANFDGWRLSLLTTGTTPGYLLTTVNSGTGTARDLVLSSATGSVRVPGTLVTGQGSSAPVLRIQFESTIAAYNNVAGLQIGGTSGGTLSYLQAYGQSSAVTLAGVNAAGGTSLLANAGPLFLFGNTQDIVFTTDNTVPKLRIRHAANTVDLGTGTALNTYNVGSAGATDWEVGFARWTSNVFEVGTDYSAGAGSSVRDMRLRTRGGTKILFAPGFGGGGDKWSMDSTGHWLVETTGNTVDFATAAKPVRTGYFGTSLVVGASAGAAASINGAVSATVANIGFNDGTRNWLGFNVNGIAGPAFTTRSAGTKIVLYPNIGAANADLAIGIENDHIWQSVSSLSAGSGFRWYGGTSLIAEMRGDRSFRIYNAFSDASNLERLYVGFSSNKAYVATEHLGTGTSRVLVLGGLEVRFAGAGGGTETWKIAGGHITPLAANVYDFGDVTNTLRTGYFGTSVQAPVVKTTAQTVATLPAAASNTGSRAFVSDSTVNAPGNFGAVVVGGGGGFVPVWCDGSSWRIG